MSNSIKFTSAGGEVTLLLKILKISDLSEDEPNGGPRHLASLLSHNSASPRSKSQGSSAPDKEIHGEESKAAEEGQLGCAEKWLSF